MEGVSCSLCEYVGNELKKELITNATIDQVNIVDITFVLMFEIDCLGENLL